MLQPSQLAQIEAKIKPILDKLKLSLFELSFVKEHGEMILRVLIEKENEEIDVDLCATVSEKISPLLDQLNFLSNQYTLEVASPGLERPIRSLEEFKKQIGGYVEMIVKEPVLNFNELIGTLVSVNQDQIELKINLKGRIKVVKISYKNIQSARTAVKF